ncbi:MAG: hypothetical protein KDK51_10575, partial [Deltaproteobacteria bacterium]|nr:hypothetical protein [Deltaproteobacteria bacterium]
AAWKSNKLPVLTLGERSFGKSIGMNLRQPAKYISAYTDTVEALYAFDIKSDGSVAWKSWQLDETTGNGGIVTDIAKQDPVLNFLQQNPEQRDFERAFTMRDYKKEEPPVIEFTAPELPFTDPIKILVPTQYQLQDDERQAMQTYAKEKQQIASCDPDAVPGNPKFSEARECLYDASIDLMRAWISYRDHM